MTNNSLDHKQRMVFVGLRRMTADRNLIIDGFRRWMDSHSSEVFNIDSVVTDLVNYLGLGSAEKKSLILALHAASNKMLDELPKVPLSLLERVSANDSTSNNVIDDIEVGSKQTIKPVSPPHCAVSEMYLQSFVQALNKHDADAFRELVDILKTEDVDDVSRDTQQLVKIWATNGLVNLSMPSTTAQVDCENLAHHIYLLFTELVGPMDSDSLVNVAINRAKSIDEASRFNPGLLL